MICLIKCVIIIVKMILTFGLLSVYISASIDSSFLVVSPVILICSYFLFILPLRATFPLPSCPAIHGFTKIPAGLVTSDHLHAKPHTTSTIRTLNHVV